MPQADKKHITSVPSGPAANTPADAAGAFSIAAQMEIPLRRIGQAKATLLIMAGDDSLEDEVVRAALNLLADVLAEAHGQAEEMRCQIFNKTWAFKHGDAQQLPVVAA